MEHNGSHLMEGSRPGSRVLDWWPICLLERQACRVYRQFPLLHVRWQNGYESIRVCAPPRWPPKKHTNDRQGDASPRSRRMNQIFAPPKLLAIEGYQCFIYSKMMLCIYIKSSTARSLRKYLNVSLVMCCPSYPPLRSLNHCPYYYSSLYQLLCLQDEDVHRQGRIV